ncbi:MAG TPA: cytochrome c biogenesis protein CcsA [Azoarcus sp.]|nr:cytochrome c biogenesis protein CcsA [Azoarcus sp.]
MAHILLHLIAASLYAGLALWLRRTLPDNRAPRTIGMLERSVLLIALITHGLALYTAMFAGGGIQFGFGSAVSMMVWLAICFYWIETFYAALHGLHALALPAGVIATLLSLVFPGQHELINVGSVAFRAHFIVSMLAYSLFTLAVLHAMLMTVAERQLHSGRISRAIAQLPPLMTMEALLFRLIGIAFILLTLALGSGVLFSEELFGEPFRANHKTVFASASWLLFGALLFGRSVWGWRGRVALRWTLAGFIALILAYFGSRFVLEVLLQRVA